MQSINHANYHQPLQIVNIKTSQTTTAHKIYEFTSKNRGSIFLGLSVLITLALSPQAIAWNVACKVAAYSLLTFSSLQIFTVLIGKNELMSAKTGEQINALLGIVNLCVLYLFPGISLGTSLVSSSIGAASLLMRNVVAIEPH